MSQLRKLRKLVEDIEPSGTKLVSARADDCEFYSQGLLYKTIREISISIRGISISENSIY